MRRVAITGAGTVNPLGPDVPATWAAMRAGRVAIGPLAGLPDLDRLAIRIGAQVTGWNPEARFPRAELPLLDRFAQFALAAAAQAVAAAGLSLTEAEGLRAGAVLGTGGGGYTTIDDSYRTVHVEGKNRVHPFTIPRLMHNAAAGHLARVHGLRGPVFTVSTACASSNHAIGLALQAIRAGSAEVMLAGGAEATLCFGGIKAWEGLRVLSPDGCRPFCASRNGMVMGEGAAVFVLESWDRATARGAPILAELAGFAMSSDAADMVVPQAEGAERAMRGALADAGLAPGAVGYINAHGTGTRVNDRTEAAAIRAVFGPAPPPVSATKAMHGHLIGAAGAVELLACLLALDGGPDPALPPTMGLCEADPDCALDLIPGAARPGRVGAALSNAFAFGGTNACLVLRRA